MTETNIERKAWIDWLKVLGMFFIVWGHMFPPHVSDFLYAFSVPLFFMTSGYLQPNVNMGGIKSKYYKKLFNRLFFPYIATCAVYLLFEIAINLYHGEFDVWRILRSILAMFIGVQSFDDGCGCVSMWFVYTLLLIKLIETILTQKVKYIVAVVCLGGAIYISQYELTWAVTDFLLAFPLYVFGQICAKQGGSVLTYLKKLHFGGKIISSVVLLFITYAVSLHNGFVKMYMGGYGNNIFLFLFGALSGTFAIFLISLALEKVKWKYLILLSTGTIVILEFQTYFLFVIHHLLVVILKCEQGMDTITFFCTIGVMLIFIPIIKFVNRYLPVFSGTANVLK